MSATLKHIPSSSSANLDAYLEREKEGNDLPRVLYEWGQHCRPETAALEFRALREKYGQQGAVRTVPASYTQPDDPAEATHLKVGKNWRAAKPGEIATHQRVAPEVPYVKRAEAIHFIWSFDLASVNPEDPEQTLRAFEAVQAFVEDDYSGTQMKLVAHGDAMGSKQAIERGERGKFHVHGAANAVLAADMEVDGRTFVAGHRMAGALTHVDRMRERWDDFLERRGHEFGLGPQDRSVLPEVRSPEARAVRRTEQDFWATQRGELSDHDRARRGIETAYAKLAADPSRVAGLSPSKRIALLADEAAATGDVELKLREQKNGEIKIRSFVVPDRAQSIGQTRLGERYSHQGAIRQLDLIAQGQWEPYERGEVGPPKRITKLDQAEVAELQRAVDGVADAEHEARLDDLRRERQQILAHPPQRFAGLNEDEVRAQLAELMVINHNGFDDRDEMARVHGLSESEIQFLTEKWWDLGRPDLSPPAIGEQAIDAQRRQEAVSADIEGPAAERQEDPQQTDRQHRESEKSSTRIAAPQQATGGKTALQVADAANTASSKPAARRAQRRPSSLTDDERKSAELIAVVQEREDGGAYVDFQLAAPENGRDRPGLHLMAEKSMRKQKDGTEREVTAVHRQLTAAQYDRIKVVAGENRVEINGRQVYAVAADINISPRGGYSPNINSLQSSRRAQIGDDVLAKQRASEDRGRQVETAELERKKSTPSVYDQIEAAQRRTRDNDGPGY